MRSDGRGRHRGCERTDRRGDGREQGINLWPLAFVLVAVIGVGGYALWRHLHAPTRPWQEDQEEETSVSEVPRDERVEQVLAQMTLEQKVAQLFVVTPEALTGVDVAVAAGDATREAIGTCPVGGLVYFSQNLTSRSQTVEMIRNVKNYCKDACGVVPFVCVDEEGGLVARVAGNEAFGVEDVGPMLDVGASGEVDQAFDKGRVIGTYLSELGFNVDFAPVADVVSGEGSALYGRSFGSDPELVGQMVAAEVQGFSRTGVLCAAKHFPGIGEAEGDSHNGRIYSSRTAKQMLGHELVPFAAAIEAGVPMVMVGHLSCLEVSKGEGDLPASMSSAVIEGLLRGKLGFGGVVVTDALNMGAATEACEADEQAVLAVQAGADVVLMPEDFEAAYKGLLGAVKTGKMDEGRIDDSCRRIIAAKLELS